MPEIRGTTILSVRRGNSVVIGGDGQVSMGNTVMKGNARKVRRLYKGEVLAGFAGLAKHQGILTKAAVELAKEWRTDRMLRKLEALLCVADKEASYVISGTGDVIEPQGGVMAIGSGGAFAESAARALVGNTEMSPKAIVEASLNVAADICVFTNHNLTIEELEF